MVAVQSITFYCGQCKVLENQVILKIKVHCNKFKTPVTQIARLANIRPFACKIV